MKKILSLILALFILLGAVIPTTHAVSFNGSKQINFPGVQGVGEYLGLNIDHKPLWSTNEDERINNVTSIICTQQGPDGNCVTYVTNVTQLFVIDIAREYSIENDYVGSISTTMNTYYDNGISFYLGHNNENGERNEQNVYLNYLFGDNNTGNLVSIGKDKKCGTENPNICVVSLNTFITYSATATTRGVYWTYSDVTLYSDQDNNIIIHRMHKDIAEGAQVGFFQSLMQKISGYKGGYGARIGDISDSPTIFSTYKGNGKGENIRLYTDQGYSSFKKEEYDSYLNPKNEVPKLVADATIGQQDETVYNNSNMLIPLMNEYLWGEHSASGGTGTGSIFITLQNVLKFKSVSSQSETNNSANPENHDKCPNLDIGCHFISGIKLFLGGFFKGLFDRIKIIFEQITKFFEGIIDGIYVALGKEPPKDEEGGFIRDIVNNTIVKWHLVLGTGQGLICDAKFNYSFTDSQKNFIAEEYKKYVPDDSFVYTFFGLFKFINPLPPTHGQEVCTYMGMKSVNYRENSWVDIILVIMFCGMILGLFYRNYN